MNIFAPIVEKAVNASYLNACDTLIWMMKECRKRDFSLDATIGIIERSVEKTRGKFLPKKEKV